MNAKQQSKFKMYRSTQSHFENSKGTFAANPAFSSSLESFSNIIAEIAAHETVVAKKITGVSKDKTKLKQTLADIAYRIGSQVFAYASKAKNNSLKKQVDFSVSDLLRIKDSLFVPALQNIYDAANNNIKDLADYSINTDDLKELNDLMSGYRDAVPTTRTAITTRAAKTKSLTELFKEGDRILKEEIDKLVTGLKKGNKLFVDEFTNARKIMDPASRPKKITSLPTVMPN